jgi:hypothetical protein
MMASQAEFERPIERVNTAAITSRIKIIKYEAAEAYPRLKDWKP